MTSMSRSLVNLSLPAWISSSTNSTTCLTSALSCSAYSWVKVEKQPEQAVTMVLAEVAFKTSMLLERTLAKELWSPTLKTWDSAPESGPGECERVVAAFVHVEPADVLAASTTETKLVKTSKWLARKWDTRVVLLHSFTHLGEEKAAVEPARALLDRAEERLRKAGYHASQTPYGYFNDLTLVAPGHPLARIYKQW